MTTPERIKRCLRRKQLAKLREEIKRLTADQIKHERMSDRFMCERDEMRVMVQVFNACIELRRLPSKGSECQEIIKRILKKP
jgi:hypothetical protein